MRIIQTTNWYAGIVAVVLISWPGSVFGQFKTLEEIEVEKQQRFQEMQRKLLEKLTKDKVFTKAPLKDVLTWLHEEIEVYFIWDAEAFLKKMEKDLPKKPVTVVVKKGMTLQEVLEKTLTPIHATFEIESHGFGFMIIPLKPK